MLRTVTGAPCQPDFLLLPTLSAFGGGKTRPWPRPRDRIRKRFMPARQRRSLWMQKASAILKYCARRLDGECPRAAAWLANAAHGSPLQPTSTEEQRHGRQEYHALFRGGILAQRQGHPTPPDRIWERSCRSSRRA